MGAQKVYVRQDRQLQKQLFSPEVYSTTDPIYFKRGDDTALLVGFLDDSGNLSANGPGATEAEASTTHVIVGFKEVGKFDTATFLTSGSVTGIDGDGFYEIEIPMGTSAINDLLGVNGDDSDDEASVEVMMEITWSVTGAGPDPAAKWNTCRRTNAVIENDVVRGTENTPPSVETPDEWLTARAVRFDAAQELTDAQKRTALGNIGAGTAVEASHTPSPSGGVYTVDGTWIGKHASNLSYGSLNLPAVTGYEGMSFAVSASSYVAVGGAGATYMNGATATQVKSVHGVCVLTAFPGGWRVTSVGAVATAIDGLSDAAADAVDADILPIYKFTAGNWALKKFSLTYVWNWIISKLRSTSTAAPASTPSKVGLFHFNTATKDAWVSLGTSSSADYRKLSQALAYTMEIDDDFNITNDFSGRKLWASVESVLSFPTTLSVGFRMDVVSRGHTIDYRFIAPCTVNGTYYATDVSFNVTAGDFDEVRVVKFDTSSFYVSGGTLVSP